MTMNAMWIEIPVTDLTRALHFYQTLFGLPPASINTDEQRKTATPFHGGEGRPGITLNQTKNFEPGDKGPLLYFDAGKNLSEYLSRVEPAGGSVITAKTDMGNGGGFYAMLKDTEGNVIALYSPE